MYRRRRGFSMSAQVLLDDDELARYARTTLAGSDAGSLLVADGGQTICSQISVSVRDDGGEAVMVVPTARAPWLNAPRPRWGSLVLEPADESGVGVTLSGRLQRLSQRANAETHPHCSSSLARSQETQVAMRVEEVWVSCPRRAELPPNVAGVRQVPLLRYANAEPDLFAANSRRVMKHLNTFHGEQLRAWAVSHTDEELEQIAGASVSSLSRTALHLWVIGPDGATGTQVEFPAALQSFDELGELIRREIESPR
ncbi:hypothetical protein SAMN05444157_2170 [Frankineae bacterium MT45]|nr:hypothetical protein SAMN05444157_2170 [Frankineae bacterium MT45]